MTNERKEIWNWLKNHAETIVILGAMASSILWMNGKFNSLELRLNIIESKLNTIEPVLIVKLL